MGYLCSDVCSPIRTQKHLFIKKINVNDGCMNEKIKLMSLEHTLADRQKPFVDLRKTYNLPNRNSKDLLFAPEFYLLEEVKPMRNL